MIFEGGASIKKKLERIEYKNYFVNSYKYMQNDCFELYAKVNKGDSPSSESFDKLVEFTNRAIEEEESNFNYCKILLDQLEDENYKTVIYLRYFKGLIVEDAAEEMFYTTGYIVVLTAKAIKELERIKQKFRRRDI